MLKTLNAMVAEFDRDASNEGDRSTGDAEINSGTAAKVTAETNGSGNGESVSAETSDEALDLGSIPKKHTGRATAIVHIAEHYLATDSARCQIDLPGLPNAEICGFSPVRA